MKFAAIICEYNPFHFGHEYQIRELRRLVREKYGSETVVAAIMSGSFTQRGEPAVFGKYVRARAALSCGADLVVELPAPWSMSGAEFFALGGVSIAKRLGADILAFGGESELSVLKENAKRLASPEFSGAFTAARESEPGLSANTLRERVWEQLYSSPLYRGSNDILALEYLRALEGSGIEPICIRRVGESYNPTGQTRSGFASASTVRKKIRAGEDFSALVPEKAFEVFRCAPVCRTENLDSIVTAYLRLGHSSMSGVEVSGGVENRLHDAAMRNFGVERIVGAALERRYSASRLRRAIFSSICGFSASDSEREPEFTNLLAANKSGCELLSSARKRLGKFILTKPADFRQLPEKARRQFEQNYAAESLWALSCDDENCRRADELLKKRPEIL